MGRAEKVRGGVLHAHGAGGNVTREGTLDAAEETGRVAVDDSPCDMHSGSGEVPVCMGFRDAGARGAGAEAMQRALLCAPASGRKISVLHGGRHTDALRPY